jgi:predicted TPR repeat methyltransferase
LHRRLNRSFGLDLIHTTVEAGALRERIGQLIDAGRTGAARPLLAAARKLSPACADIPLLAARLAMRDGDLDQATQELDVAIAEFPADPALRKIRAEVRQLQGDREGAARDAAEAVILDRDDIQAKVILGITMLDLGRATDAVHCLEEAVIAAPAVMVYRQTLATAVEAAGDADAALVVLSDAIALGPTDLMLRNAAILLCMRRRDYRRAVEFAEQARVAGIADAAMFAMKGHALASLESHEEANLAYREALKLEPNDPYVRHLVMAGGGIPGGARAAPEYIRAVFDGYACRFDSHLKSLSYRTPGRIRAALQSHPKITAGVALGPVLDLGCGTGLAALEISDLNLGPITGVDLSRRMLDQARAKRLYAELREAEILADLGRESAERWPLIIAADVLCYFGALETVLAAVHGRLQSGGWFVFSTEELLPDHDGIMPGNGSWAPHRQGRYAHSLNYVHEAAWTAGFRVLRTDRHSTRREAGSDVLGVLFVVERLANDD